MLSYKILGQYIEKKSNKIAVATSGGADSMCLLYLTQLWCNDHNLELTALIVDHKLRTESTAEAQEVANIIQDRSIKAKVLTWEGKKPEANIHHHARKARYKLLTDYCKREGIEKLLVAHNLQDQAETVLLRIYRGSGIDGIAGINRYIKFNGIEVIRPLLEVNRQQIEDTLKIAEWPWIEDPSNQNLKFDRVKVRQFIEKLPDKGTWLNRINLLASNARRAKDYLHQVTAEKLESCVEFNEFGYASLNLNEFLKLHEEIGLRVLVVIFKALSGKEFKPRLNNLEHLYYKIQSKGLFTVTLGNLKIKSKKSLIIFYRELYALEEKVALKAGITCVWDHRFQIKLQNSGFFVGGLGQENWLKIRKSPGDYPLLPFVEIYYTLLAIYDGKGNLVAAPHLNYYNSKLKLKVLKLNN